MHGTDAWLADVPEFAHLYTHTCLARRKQLVSGKNLQSRDLNTRPLLATSLNPFYNKYWYIWQIFCQFYKM